MLTKIFRDLIVLVSIFGILWFSIYQISKPVSLPKMTLSDETREKLKEFLEEQIEKNYNLIESHEWEANIEEIMNRFYKSGELKEPSYEIKVLDSEMINAFVTVGNTVYVFKGLLKFSENNEELASVIAHELGHIDLQHIESRLLTDFGLTVLTLIISGGDPTLATQIVKEVSSGAYSRKHENEADDFALKLMLQSNIDPVYLGIMFKRLKARYKDELFRDFELMSSHPVMEKRIKKSFEFDKAGMEIKEFDTPWPNITKNPKEAESE
jgi:beta-barrel assembly-enhancing protease